MSGVDREKRGVGAVGSDEKSERRVGKVLVDAEAFVRVGLCSCEFT